MPRYEVRFKTGATGKRMHVVKAYDREEAKKRVRRAYPKEKVSFDDIERLPGTAEEAA